MNTDTMIQVGDVVSYEDKPYSVEWISTERKSMLLDPLDQTDTPRNVRFEELPILSPSNRTEHGRLHLDYETPVGRVQTLAAWEGDNPDLKYRIWCSPCQKWHDMSPGEATVLIMKTAMGRVADAAEDLTDKIADDLVGRAERLIEDINETLAVPAG